MSEWSWRALKHRSRWIIERAAKYALSCLPSQSTDAVAARAQAKRSGVNTTIGTMVMTLSSSDTETTIRRNEAAARDEVRVYKVKESLADSTTIESAEDAWLRTNKRKEVERYRRLLARSFRYTLKRAQAM